MDAGIREFGERGYDGASVRAIAGGAGVTTPVIYDHFSSKRALYIAILEQEEADLRKYQQRDRGVQYGRELAHSVIDDFFHWVEEHPQTWRMIFRDLPTDPEILAAQRRAQSRSLGQIQSFVARNPKMDRTAMLAPEVVEQLLSKSAYAVNNELAAWWLDNPQVERRQIVDTAVSFLVGAAESLNSNPHSAS